MHVCVQLRAIINAYTKIRPRTWTHTHIPSYTQLDSIAVAKDMVTRTAEFLNQGQDQDRGQGQDQDQVTTKP